VINRLPWFTADDPPDVQKLLANYSIQPVEGRRTVVMGLSQLPDQGFKVLLRIIANEPSDSVRWEMVRVIESSEDAAHKVAARGVAVVPDSPPLLALAGWAWFEVDQAKSTNFFQKGFDQWKLSPHDATPEETSMLLEPLYQGDVLLKRYDAAADVLRAEVRTPGDNVDLLLFRLFALHAEHGPLRGYDEDRILAGTNLDSPLLLLCQSEIDERLMMPEQAKALRAKALAATTNDFSAAHDVAVILVEGDWSDLAAEQLRAIINTPPAANAAAPEMLAEAHFELAEIHARDGEDEQAARDQQAAIDLMSPQDMAVLAAANAAAGDGANVGGQLVFVNQRWSELKAARAKNDVKTAQEKLDALVKLNPQNADIVQDIVPMLTAAGRDADARALFDRVYVPLRADVDADPANPMYQNNLAWFCSQSNQRLEEADALARQAVSAMPHEASFIDTLAFCEYRLGRASEAVRLETIALSLDPKDIVMIQSLDRYRAAVGR